MNEWIIDAALRKEMWMFMSLHFNLGLVLYFFILTGSNNSCSPFQGERKKKGIQKETRTAERELKLELIFQVYRGTLDYESVWYSFCFKHLEIYSWPCLYFIVNLCKIVVAKLPSSLAPFEEMPVQEAVSKVDRRGSWGRRHFAETHSWDLYWLPVKIMQSR